jgi:hypothetical protein
MTERRPRLVWVDTEEVEVDREVEEDYFNPKLDELLRIAGNDRYIGRTLQCIRGNLLRGRERNSDTLNIWHLDDFQINKLATTNQSIHGTVPTLIGDTWGEMIWKGPMIAVMKVGNTYDPRRVTDMTLTGYRDAIDYLGYYRDTYGSMVDGPGSRAHLAKRILADRAGKVRGVRVNCVGDQANKGEGDVVAVDVPKTHPLFNLEGDDPLSIPDILGWAWVAKRYRGQGKTGSTSEGGTDNPVARQLLTQTSLRSEKWGGVCQSWQDPLGSVLIVNRRGGDLDVGRVRKMYDFIEQVVGPLMTVERGRSEAGRREVLDSISMEAFSQFVSRG